MAEFTQQLDKAGSQVESMGKKMTGSAGVATVALGNLAAMGAEKAISALIGLGTQLLEVGGQLTDTAAKTGMSTTALQELGFAASQSGISMETITNAVSKLGANLAKGDKGATAALKELGISMDDIKGKTPEEVFYRMAEGFDTVDSAGKRSALALAAFGKSGMEVLPALNSEFIKTAQSASEMGIVLGPETVKAADALGDQVDILKLQLFALIGNALAPMMPLLTELMTSLGEIARATIPPLVKAFVWMMETTAKLQKVFLEFLLAIAEGAQKIPGLGSKLGIAQQAADALRERIAKTDERIAALGKTSTDTGTAAGGMGRNLLNAGEAALNLGGNAKQATDEIAKLRDALFGKDAIANAEKYVKALGGIQNVSQLTADKQKEFAGAMQAGIAAMEATGRGLDPLAEQFRELNRAVATVAKDSMPSFVKELNQATQAALLPKVTAEPGIKFEAFAMPEWVTESMSRYVTEMKKIEPEAAEAGEDAGEIFGREFGGKLGESIIKAFEGGGNPGAALGAMIGSEAVKPLVAQIQVAFGEKGLKGSLGGMISGLVSAGGAALGAKLIKTGSTGQQVGASMGSTIGGSLVQGLAKTVATKIGGTLGATLGSAVPILGTIAGGMLGSLVGGLFGPSQASQTKKARNEWIEAAGGLEALNKTAKETGVSIDGIMKAGKVKTLEAEIAKFEKAVEAVNVEVKALGANLGKIAANKTLLNPSVLKQIDKLGSNPALQEDLFAFFQKSTQTASDGLTRFFENAKVSSQGAATAIGSSFAVVFEDFRAQGMTATEAFAAMAPAMQTFSAQLQATGMQGGAAFEALNAQMQLMTDAFTGPLIAGADALADVFVGLANSGRMNQEIFAGLTAEVSATFAKIEGSGAGSVRAVQSLQRPLQTIWELWQDQGFAVDETTQGILEFAVQQGVVGDKFRDKQDQMVQAVQKLVERLDKLVSVMTNDLPAGADTAAKGIEDKLGGIKVPTIVIPYRYEAQNSPPSAAAASVAPSGLSGSARSTNITVEVDGRTLAEVTAQNMPRAVAPYGINQ